jgi:hypothetical protein
LKAHLKAGDRKQVRQLLHQMSPQLQFFGIKDIAQPIRRLEHEYETMPYKELSTLVDNIVTKLNLAIKDEEGIDKSLANIGQIYIGRGDLALGLEHLNRSEKSSKKRITYMAWRYSFSTRKIHQSNRL